MTLEHNDFPNTKTLMLTKKHGSVQDYMDTINASLKHGPHIKIMHNL